MIDIYDGRRGMRQGEKNAAKPPRYAVKRDIFCIDHDPGCGHPDIVESI